MVFGDRGSAEEGVSVYRVKVSPLYLKARETLVRLIKDAPDGSNRLPSEEELIRTMGVSRSTVREALLALSHEGIISKRQGLGNFFHRSALEYPMRVDLVYDFVELLQRAGYQVELRQSPFSQESSPEGIGEGEFLKFTWIYLADGKPAIRADMFIPCPRLKEMPDANSIERSLPEFLRKYCGEKTVQSVAQMDAVLPSPDIAKTFDIPAMRPVIRWNEVYFNLADERIAFARVFFSPDVVSLSMIRKDLH